ncbi:MAG: carbohydrate porin [Halothiobacillus sp.]
MSASKIDQAAEPATENNTPTENWQTHAQTTGIGQYHPSFNAPYTGSNSLIPQSEQGYSVSGTAFFGARLLPNTEIYFNPEVFSGKPFSNLLGLGGLTNGENQRGGGVEPHVYVARLFVRQTWNLGGTVQAVDDDQNQLAGAVDSRRMVFTLGRIALTDIFDTNKFTGDPRTQFFNWSLLADGAYDYAGNARGYTSGTAIEGYWDDWALRYGRFLQPSTSNGPNLNNQVVNTYGDQLEIEHDHVLLGQPGAVRVLMMRNRARMGSYTDALAYWNANGRQGVPDLANVRAPHVKIAYALNIEQNITPDVGMFVRASHNDGRYETFAFSEIEHQVSAGLAVQGTNWGRSADTWGLAVAQNGISNRHRAYLAAGGLGAFIGDGQLPKYGPERVFETYYSVAVNKFAAVSLDYQHIANPAYNPGRGPVNFFGARTHLAF